MLIGILLWLPLTILLFQLLGWFFEKIGRRPFFHPVAWSIFFLVCVLLFFHVPYQNYFAGTKILHLLLGPSTIALAIPLYEEREKIRRLVRPLFVSLFAGSLAGIFSALGIAKIFGASLLTLKSVAAKSVTTPIAMAITEKIGGDISLIAVMVILTGTFGAMFGFSFMRFLPFQDNEAKAFAMGVSCHGVGTARAFQESVEMGALAGLAIGLNGLLTSFLLPLIIKFLAF